MVRITRGIALLCLGTLGIFGDVFARPTGPQAICIAYPASAQCQDGAQPGCDTCHTTPPARNPFGSDIEAQLPPDSDAASFINDVVPIVQGLLADDADDDGYTNEDEFIAGTSPGDRDSKPSSSVCSGESVNPNFNVCGYDHRYTFKKILLDFCGYGPTWAEIQAFEVLTPAEKMARIHDNLDTCLDSAYWQGRDGVLWRMAHPKVRPLAAIKSGANAGPVPLADYTDDYALFVHTQIDDNDARDVLLANYYVTYSNEVPRYRVVDSRPDQGLQLDRRAGMMTTRWFFVINTMFTAVPRTAAAQAYRSYLDFDIAKSEGLIPPEGEALVDYDSKGITEAECAVCHTTLDPLTYPFSRYNGIEGLAGFYNPNRMAQKNPAIEGERIRETPEAGYLLGQPVADLMEWAQVAANSDEFAEATVSDYWRILFGRKPTAAERPEFETLSREFQTVHNYRVERMLHALIETEAYGVP